MVFAEVAFAHLRQNRDVIAVQDIAVGLDDILGRHSGRRQHGADVLPDQLRLCREPLGHGAIGGDANTVHLITVEGVENWPRMSKPAVAERLAQRISEALEAAS